MWRKGRFLTRETAGYSDQIAGFQGQRQHVDTEHPLAHNTLLFEGWNTGRWVGRGPHVIPVGGDRGEQPRGLPEVRRLQHEPQFGYVAVDYSDAYRNMPDSRVDWPYADKAWREFVFIRPLQALVISRPHARVGRLAAALVQRRRLAARRVRTSPPTRCGALSSFTSKRRRRRVPIALRPRSARRPRS
jgi:hypothetical protein